MMYAESSYAGPDMHGRTFAAHHFQHIAERDEHLRLRRIMRACREAEATRRRRDSAYAERSLAA